MSPAQHPFPVQARQERGVLLGLAALFFSAAALLALIVFFCAGCTVVPAGHQPSVKSLAWIGAMTYQGQPGEHGRPLARELWLSYLSKYGAQIEPKNPDPNEGWTQLPDGTWFAAQPQVYEWGVMNFLADNDLN